MRLGALDLQVALDAADGETVAVLGPNGAGKSTLLRALAGLVAIDGGRIVLDDTPVDDPATGTFVEPEAAQGRDGVPGLPVVPAPHGARERRVRPAEPGDRPERKRADKPPTGWAGWGWRIAPTPRRRRSPAGSSSGSRSARALVTHPRLLLLDEPLAALDVGTRTELRRDLRSHLATFSGARVIVTHELLDAVALADRLVVLEDGRVAQSGTVREVADAPRSRYVADLVGVNLLHGSGHGHQVVLEGGGVVVTADAVDGDVYVAIQPHSVSLHRAQPEGSPRNVWRGLVRGADLLGDRVRIHVDGPVPVVAEVTAAAVGELGLHEGVDVWATVKATDLSVYAV